MCLKEPYIDHVKELLLFYYLTYIYFKQNFICQWLATGRWYFSGTPVFSINKTALHDIAEILFKVALSILNRPSIIQFSLKYEAQSNATEPRGIFRPMLGLEYNMII